MVAECQPARVARSPARLSPSQPRPTTRRETPWRRPWFWGASGGSVNSDGVYTAPDGAGTFEVVARAGSGATDSARVEVSSPPVASAPVVQSRFERLARGVNLTYWFSMGVWRPDYMSEADLVQLRQLGFTFVRLPILPGVIFDETEPGRPGCRIGELDRAVQLILDAGLAVVVDLHPEDDQFRTRLQSDNGFVAAVAAFWKSLASNLSSYDPDSAFLEVLNEPQFSDANRWNQVARTLVAAVRQGAPAHTIVLSGPGCCQAEGLAGTRAPVRRQCHLHGSLLHARRLHPPGSGLDRWIGLRRPPRPPVSLQSGGVRRTRFRRSRTRPYPSRTTTVRRAGTPPRSRGDIHRIANWSRSHGDVPGARGPIRRLPGRRPGPGSWPLPSQDTRRALERDGWGWARDTWGTMRVASA